MPRLLGEYELNAPPTIHGASIRGLHVVSTPSFTRAALRTISMIKVFISGPMTGLPNYNLDAFRDAAKQLEGAGYYAMNPGARGIIPGYTWSDYMRDSIRMLMFADEVVVLPGWLNSDGALIEVGFAKRIGMRVTELEEFLS